MAGSGSDGSSGKRYPAGVLGVGAAVGGAVFRPAFACRPGTAPSHHAGRRGSHGSGMGWRAVASARSTSGATISWGDAPPW